MSDETYLGAFLSGMNNEEMSTHVRTSRPATLEDALQYAIEHCGEYGEGLSVVDWQAAKRSYRPRGAVNQEDAGQRKKAAKSEMASQFDWKQLGFGTDAPPMYDSAGDAVNGLAETAKKDPMSLATLRALMLAVGVGGKTAEPSEQNVKPAAGKAKARALEVKAERTAPPTTIAAGALHSGGRAAAVVLSGGRAAACQWKRR